MSNQVVDQKRTVSIEYLAQARTLAHVGSETIDLPPPYTLTHLVKYLGLNHRPSLAPLLLQENNEPRISNLFTVGTQQVFIDDTYEIRPNDHITILPPMSGG